MGTAIVGPRLGRFTPLRRKAGTVGEIKFVDPMLTAEDLLDLKNKIVRRTRKYFKNEILEEMRPHAFRFVIIGIIWLWFGF